MENNCVATGQQRQFKIGRYFDMKKLVEKAGWQLSRVVCGDRRFDVLDVGADLGHLGVRWGMDADEYDWTGEYTLNARHRLTSLFRERA